MRVAQYQYIYIYIHAGSRNIYAGVVLTICRSIDAGDAIYIYIHTYIFTIYNYIYSICGKPQYLRGAGLSICRSKDTGDGIYMREARISTRAQYQQSAAIRAGDAIRVFINRGIYAGAGRRGTKIPYQYIKKDVHKTCLAQRYSNHQSSAHDLVESSTRRP